MAIVRANYINATGGYQQPLAPNADAIITGGFYAQNSATVDTACGVSRPADTQLQLAAGGNPGLALNATGGIPTLNAPGVDATGVSLRIAGGQLVTPNGLVFSDQTLQTGTASTVLRTTAITNTTTTNATSGMSFTLAASTAYAFEAYVIIGRTVGSTATLRLQFALTPSAAVSSWSGYRNNNLPGSAGSLVFQANPFSTMFNMSPNASGTTSTTYAIALAGVFAPSGPDPAIDLRFSPSVASQEMTIYPGSYFTIRAATT
jgi:hypothetical protein